MAVDPDRVQGWFRVDDPMVEGWQGSLHRQDLVAAGAYALVPRSSLGPALNDQGYYVGQVERNLHWVTDGVYQSAFLTTRDGVVLFDAPPGISHNLQRAVDEIAAAIGVSKTVTHLVRYGENVWAGVKAHLDTVTERAAAPIIAKYTGVLAAADIEVFTRTATFTILQSMRLDLRPSSPLHP